MYHLEELNPHRKRERPSFTSFLVWAVAAVATVMVTERDGFFFFWVFIGERNGRLNWNGKQDMELYFRSSAGPT